MQSNDMQQGGGSLYTYTSASPVYAMNWSVSSAGTPNAATWLFIEVDDNIVGEITPKNRLIGRGSRPVYVHSDGTHHDTHLQSSTQSTSLTGTMQSNARHFGLLDQVPT